MIGLDRYELNPLSRMRCSSSPKAKASAKKGGKTLKKVVEEDEEEPEQSDDEEEEHQLVYPKVPGEEYEVEDEEDDSPGFPSSFPTFATQKVLLLNIK